MHDAALFAAGASLQGMQAVLCGDARHAYNMAGGLHHARRDQASGFCIFNDAALAIEHALDVGLRVAYVDLDAHHGDGVQTIFYEEPRVLTISIHESGRYLFPGTGAVSEQGAGPGAGTSINVPLPPGSGDAVFRAALREVVEPAVRSYRPDILVTQTGCDAHWTDPLSHLAATLPLFPEMAGRLHSLAHEVCGGRWLVLGGGGYTSSDITPRAWAAVFGTVIGRRPLPHDLVADAGPGHDVLDAGAIAPVLHELRETVLSSLDEHSASV
jgi:acetoin utilization protein AcuC